MQDVRVIKDGGGKVLTSEGSVLRRCKEWFKELINVENERERERLLRTVSESAHGVEVGAATKR